MSTSTITRAGQLAAQLLGVGIRSTLEPADVARLAPCVLLAPPRLAFDTYDEPTPTWRLTVVASKPLGRAAWEELDELVLLAATVLPVEAAEPVGFALAPTDDPMPAYALTLTGA